MIIHETKSIVVIALDGSSNRKTGPGVQVWILDRTMHPSDSRRSGTDAKRQCRGCPLSSYRGCYVIDMPLISIWKKYQAGDYPKHGPGSQEFRDLFYGKYVRLGAYGNPSLIPLRTVKKIAGLARRITGYFHDWHLMPAPRARAYGQFLMASTHPHDVKRAWRLGLRTFTTGAMAGEQHGIECLSDSHGITCSQCGLCDGNLRRRDLPNVWIRPHGYQSKALN